MWDSGSGEKESNASGYQ